MSNAPLSQNTPLTDKPSSSAVRGGPAPPQIIVAYGGTSKAYGRAFIKGMDLHSARQMFITDLGVGAEEAKKMPKFLRGTFYHRHLDGDASNVWLDERSWAELIGNTTRIELLGPPFPAKWNWTPVIVTVVLVYAWIAWRMSDTAPRHASYNTSGYPRY
ncbi:hypothetical protein PLICRDRAFT_172591 [Plicaturopsis crispa FD-325 SS-3]|nr:hypothetical protein PLICRDRAFT_172591 [Plicaturopsis crispa FD-325 SS-3]